jgi:hypothetical protein
LSGARERKLLIPASLTLRDFAQSPPSVYLTSVPTHSLNIACDGLAIPRFHGLLEDLRGCHFEMTRLEKTKQVLGLARQKEVRDN